MTKVTLRIIAEETGLSKYAVSRALAGKSGVSDATRARVIQVAERLGYKGSAPARQQQIAAVFDASDVINSELNMLKQAGAQAEAERLGYSFKVHWISAPDEVDPIARTCAGLLLVGSGLAVEAVRRIRSSGVPLVRIGRLHPMERVDAALGTDREGAFAMGQHLLELGHREIVYVHGDRSLSGRADRLHGLREAMRACPDTLLHDLTWPSDGSFSEAADRLLETTRPTAWFCAHDRLALSVFSHLLARGIRIPSDASVVGHGDSAVVRELRPRLTTIHVYGAEQGAAAVNLLDRRIRHPQECPFPIRMTVPGSLVIRDSCGAA